MVPVGSRVNVSLQPAVEPAELVTVPDLSTLTLAQARAVCDRLGLDLVEPVGADGRIVGQQPAAGVRVPVGTAVTVTVDDPIITPRRLLSLAAVVLVAGAVIAAVRALRGPRTPPAVSTELTPHPGPPDQVAIGETGGTPSVPRSRIELVPRAGTEQVELEGTQR